ncbi:hypothetical protein PPACK8108_LOCUS24968, partial [Phakopsora pachyrhizi]
MSYGHSHKKVTENIFLYFYFISLLFYAPLILGYKLCFCTFDTRLQVVFYILYVFFVSQMFGQVVLSHRLT